MLYRASRHWTSLVCDCKLIWKITFYFLGGCRFWIVERGLNYWWTKQKTFSSRYVLFISAMAVRSLERERERELGEACDWWCGEIVLWIQADSFQRQGRQLRRKMWLQNLRLKLMVGGIVLVLIIILWLIACKGFKCWWAWGAKFSNTSRLSSGVQKETKILLVCVFGDLLDCRIPHPVTSSAIKLRW